MSLSSEVLHAALNEAQYRAVTTTDGPLLVFAGAGSGKTRVITYRAAHIVESGRAPPWRVMCVTFTNKAAGEMRQRCAALLDEATARDLWVSTFHSAGARILRRYHVEAGLPRSFAIYDDSDQRSLMSRLYDEMGIDPKVLHPRAALASIDRLKQDLVEPDALLNRARSEHELIVANVYANYQHRLAAAGALDFGDLLMRPVDLLRRNETVRDELRGRAQYLMVDEFQDTNAAQFAFVHALIGAERNVCVVGDDDQMIYQWRGADVRNIAAFRTDFEDAAVIKLEQNYRSTGRILAAANAVVRKLRTREDKTLFTRNAEGAPIEVIRARDEREEATRVVGEIARARRAGLALRDHAVFYRIHAQSRPFEEALRVANVPYVVVGGMRFYDRAEIKDALAYMRLVMNPDDDVSFLRVANQPPRGIGKTTLDRVAAHARTHDRSVHAAVVAGDFPPDLGVRPRKLLAQFVALRATLADEAAHARPADAVSLVLQRTGYADMLADDADPDNATRRENLRELIGSIAQFQEQEGSPSLSDYLERITLDDTAPRSSDEDRQATDRLALMSVHSAKGLEFDTVFVTGLEEQMFPYKGWEPGADGDEIDEERRLMYVAITRARKRLVVSYATFRQIFGTTRANPPSRFLVEMPDSVLSEPIVRKPAAPTIHVADRGDGTRVEYDDPMPMIPDAPTSAFRPGMMVHHARFGDGKVRAVEAGSDLKLVVYFPGLGEEKRVLADYVRKS